MTVSEARSDEALCQRATKIACGSEKAQASTAQIADAREPPTARDDDDLKPPPFRRVPRVAPRAGDGRAAPAKTLAELEAEAARLNAQQQQPSQNGEKRCWPSRRSMPELHRQILELEQSRICPA